MAELPGASVVVDDELVVLVFGAAVVDIKVIEFIILSIIDTGFSVVPSFTFGGKIKRNCDYYQLFTFKMIGFI